jgi:hypothetical protein
MGWRCSAAAAILGCLAAGSAAAANPGGFFHQNDEQSRAGAYIGVTLSVLTSDAPTAGPGLRLGLGTGYQAGSNTFGSTGAAPKSAIALDLTRRPDIYVGGRRLSAAKDGSGWSTGEVILAIAGAAAAVLLVTELTSSDDNDDDERCMIEPELCD